MGRHAPLRQTSASALPGSIRDCGCTHVSWSQAGDALPKSNFESEAASQCSPEVTTSASSGSAKTRPLVSTDGVPVGTIQELRGRDGQHHARNHAWHGDRAAGEHCSERLPVRVREVMVGRVLLEEKGVDRDDDDVFVSMHDKGSLPDVPQHGVSVLRGRGTPFADRVQLSARCPTGCAGKIRLVESRKIAKEKSENSDAMRTL
jgi:hypothetical protein